MSRSFFNFLRALRLEDDDERRTAQTTRWVLWVCIASIVAYALLTRDSGLPLSRRWPLCVALLVAIGCERTLVFGFVKPQAWLVVSGLTALGLQGQWTSGGLRAPSALTSFIAVILAGQLLGAMGATVVALVASIGAVAIAWCVEHGLASNVLVHSERAFGRALVVHLLGAGGLMAIAASGLSATLRRLRSEQRVLHDLLENAPDAIVRLDENGRVIAINRAQEQLIQLPREQIVGNDFETYAGLSAEGLAQARRHFGMVMNDEPAPLFRFQVTRPDGSVRVAESNGRKVIRADGSRGVDVVLRDVTDSVEIERRERDLQEQLRSARKLEAIGQLAGGVAHDFNNLLTVVLGNVELLRLTRLDSEQQGYLDDVAASAKRAATITAQLLAIGRRQPAQPRALSINDSVRGLAAIFRRLVPEHVSITTRLARDLPSVVVDPGQLEQVALNLVANARDAMEEGGELTISTFATGFTNAEAPGSIPPGSYAVLRVTDTGHGMTEETVSHIFEPFFTTKGLAAGTGLGLATVYGIVKQSGGHVSVESKPGVGTTFSIFLPASLEALSAARLERAKPVDSRAAHILLVDDDAAIRHVIGLVLRRAGHRVDEAPNGKVALERAVELAPTLELLITDVVMPDLGGLELSERLRARFPQLKILLFSGYPEREIPEALANSPGFAYVAKPVAPALLLERVQELLLD